jgi:hypothetical protein
MIATPPQLEPGLGSSYGADHAPIPRDMIASSPPASRNDIVTMEWVLPWWFSNASLFAAFGSLFG